ncbi:MAG: prepilin-type N-terminal cleavage/methylation domain-containing protein [Kiritimatiellales bacterium]|nr:prepilin-type N-terminal cleavage/methylation domain-containing protein [Kiritimatiellales bacterium]
MMTKRSKHRKKRPGFFQCLEKFNAAFPTIGKTSTGNHQSAIGLTLIEVMLAIVILGVGAGTLLVATARCMAVATKAKHYSTAHRLLLRVDTENPLTRGEIEDGVESGKFEDGYSWEREVLESENEDREGLYTVRTRVGWSARGRDAFEETITYLYVPPKEKKATRMGSRKTKAAPERRRR